MSEDAKPEAATAVATAQKDLPPAAQRALQEAQNRREKLEAEKAARAKEVGGRGGEDPARYGDWEVKGIAIDF